MARIKKSDTTWGKPYLFKDTNADFKKDLADPDKHTMVRHHSRYFYHVVPHGMIDVHHVPEWAGLMYVSFRGGIKNLCKTPVMESTVNIVKIAPKHKQADLDFTASITHNFISAGIRADTTNHYIAFQEER